MNSLRDAAGGLFSAASFWAWRTRANGLSVGVRVGGDEGFLLLGAAGQQAVTPALELVEILGVGLAAAVQALDIGLNGLEIGLLAHQFPDKTEVALECAAGSVAVGLFQCGTELVGQRQLLQLRGFELNQAAPQFLIGLHLALDLALAFLFVLRTVMLFRKFCHGCCLSAATDQGDMIPVHRLAVRGTMTGNKEIT